MTIRLLPRPPTALSILLLTAQLLYDSLVCITDVLVLHLTTQTNQSLFMSYIYSSVYKSTLMTALEIETHVTYRTISIHLYIVGVPY